MKYSILFLLSLFCNDVFGQEYPEPKRAIRVIAIPGLNMRDEPDLTSKKIAYLPYGTEVKILEKYTLQDDLVDLGVCNFFNKKDSKHPDPNIHINGIWVKVEYEGKAGYVFSAYIFGETDRTVNYYKIEDEYVLLYEGDHCDDNYQYNKDWFYYGCYRSDEDGSVCFEPIELSYFVVKSDFTGICIVANQYKSSEFIIGSKHPLSENSFEATLGRYNGMDREEKIDSSVFDLVAKGYRETEELVLKRDGLRQVLNPWTNQLKEEYNNFNDVIFSGDIDQDGKDDYIIQFGSKYGQTVLFISSLARSGEIVRPVSIWYSGYCC